jgi:D-alanyl-D-alanine carboxypeptidase (penicillin-binding protein 5/6)
MLRTRRRFHPRLALVRVGTAAVVALLVAAASAVGASAQGTGELTTKARHAVVMDAETGAIMFQHRADDLVPPASMSKLMTLAMVFKALEEGKLTLESELLVSENAWRRGGAPSRTSAMMIPINTRVKLDEILQGIVVQSGNDASIAVAEGMSGSEAAFARAMTEEARRIGLRRSEFRNATGLGHPEHRMSARELAILTRHLIRTYPKYYPRFAQREFTWTRHRFFNRNPLLGANLGVDGLKTGFTSEAGYGVVLSATQEGRRLIVVLMGLPTENDRRDEGRRVLEWGFRTFTEAKVFDAGEIIGHARVWGGDRFYVGLQGKGDVAIVLSRFPASQKLRGDIIYQAPLKPPIKAGDQVATLRITSSAGAQNEVPLYAAEDVGPGGILRRGLDSLAFMAERAMSDALARVKESALEKFEGATTPPSPASGPVTTAPTETSAVGTARK